VQISTWHFVDFCDFSVKVMHSPSGDCVNVLLALLSPLRLFFHFLFLSFFNSLSYFLPLLFIPFIQF
jgi:hypothetical protein